MVGPINKREGGTVSKIIYTLSSLSLSLYFKQNNISFKLHLNFSLLFLAVISIEKKANTI